MWMLVPSYVWASGHAHTERRCDTTQSDRRSRKFRICASAGGRSLLVARAGRVRVLLEARHAVVDVAGVRVHGRHANRGEVVGEVQ